MRYGFIEVVYRNGSSEQFPPDYKLRSDGEALWIFDALGPLYRRPLGSVAVIALQERAV